MNDEPISEREPEAKPEVLTESYAAAKLKKALAELKVAGIPVGVDSINALNHQVQILEVRVLALEGRL